MNILPKMDLYVNNKGKEDKHGKINCSYICIIVIYLISYIKCF